MAHATHSWDPQTYLAFGDDRSRPFFDLLAQVGAESPEYVVDLGCGPGNLTSTLCERWQAAHVHGVDASAEMVARADETRSQHSEGTRDRLSFEVADLREWRPPRPVDVLVSNATLQWVPDHLALLADLAGRLRPGGWLAFQVPGNFGGPSHRLLADLARDTRFAAYTGDVDWPASHDPEAYLTRLHELGTRAQAWETTYLHVLEGSDPVMRWMSGTGARPVLQALPPRLRAEFEEEYAAALREAYPVGAVGTVLSFRRIFAVAQAPA
ncbi:MAG TPA: methyltransferase domain-containing protein [Nocardioidaceae bacterium]|nr:methyltransferase domain-containing protein [Nocardioidaceae bacterium]